jgi:hypothetical protein
VPEVDAVAVGVWEGPAHVCRWASPLLIELSEQDPTGMPAREAFPDYECAQDAMDRAYRTGRIVTFQHPEAVLRITPVRVEGVVRGLVTAWLPQTSSRLPSPVPATRPLAGRLAVRE